MLVRIMDVSGDAEGRNNHSKPVSLYPHVPSRSVRRTKEDHVLREAIQARIARWSQSASPS